MAEYSLAIYRRFRRFPQQVVLYVGRTPLRMPESIESASLSFRCRVVDIRQLDGEALLVSENPEENVIAVLMRLRNEREAVRRILRRIAESEPARREIALRELIILGGLRSLGAIIEQETKKMPILDEQTIVMRQIEKRFGAIPAWARQRLEAMSAGELEETALRLLDVQSLESLLSR